ncbi:MULTISPECIES: redoxin domain-containing protein [unclassified Sporosarcina]|uniref:redoxin domain-containing protein n=1 Tax=unclassified Sporosarcina TaxID=2647733 RepID=UPI000C169675|nr:MULTISPECIES: redoxin domain-containing protein [unclassified Sporosarcina]PID14947.1 thiol-disulfide oxidoreductase [Sporosarcina sp. P34]PID24851.1 thiol-disulfide oxidoreductase [Sporosarcina sp. P7]
MKKRTVGLLITALIIGTLIVMTVKSNMETAEPIDTIVVGADTTTIEYESGLEEGNTPPDFELSTLSDDIIKLTDYKGKKVILNFWASWCGPCKAEMPHIQNYYEKNKDSANVEIIAVNLTTAERSGLEGIEKFVDAYGLTFPIPLDNDGEVMNAYNILPIPTTYMIGTDGKIKHKIIGPMDEKTIKELVDNLD